MKRHSMLKLFALAAAASTVVAACGSSTKKSAGGASTAAPKAGASTAAPKAGASTAAPAAGGGSGAVTLKYQLWDDKQLPFYQQCAADFTKANPNIKIDIKQLGWSDYWDGLTAGFASGDVPDVFTDHLAKYPDFIKSAVLVPLDDFVAKDKVDLNQYAPGLAELWIGYDGKRYGLPKDFDTIALVADQTKLDAAGVKAADFDTATWNPADGGTWEKLVAKLTVDTNGKKGDEAGFDKSKIKQYGFGMDTGDAYGQTGFSSFAVSNGFSFLDKDPWGKKYNYDSPAFTDTIKYFRGLIEKGFMSPTDEWASTGGDTMFTSGKVAMRPNGSWTINQWSTDKNVKGVFVKTPKGPKGYASMFNGLADSITTGSKHPNEAWQWVKYLASPACENVVGKGGVVFPAIPEAAKASQDAHKAAGVDVTAFTSHLDNKTTFLFPITLHPAEINKTIGTAIDTVLLGKGDASAIVEANKTVNALLASG